jgi:branched-chain amino acid transport system substrate-binding protein
VTREHSWSWRFLVAAVVIGAMVSLTACGGDDSSSTSASGGTPVCGLGNGEQATGDPIKIGAVVTNGSGVDFSSATDAAAAFFDCVNANGGLNGRPVDYIVENDELNPEKAAQVATKLVQDDQVEALVASTSFVDCPVNAQLYADNGYKIVYGVGVPEQCFKSEAFAPTNTGPQLSGVGAAQYAVETLGATKLVGLAPNIPNVGTYTNDGIEAYADSVGVEFEGFVNDIPLADPQAVAVQAAQAAGSDGAVVLVMPAPFDIAVMKAAEAAGVADTTKWTCATPCNDLSFPEAVGSFWDDKIFTNSELALTDSDGPDNQLWLKVMDDYGNADDPRDNFSQAGFIAAKIFTDAVLTLDAADMTKEKISEAIAGVKNYESDIFCKPWYWPVEGMEHYPNNADRTVVLQGGKQVEAENGGCFDIAFPGADDLRAQEEENDLNTGR